MLLAGCVGVAPRPSDLLVFAAASLHAVFTELSALFQAQRPGARVTLQFAASPQLREQIEQGAPADVFAAASSDEPRRLVERGLLLGDPVPFARNTIVLAVPLQDPARIASLADLARPGVRLVIAAAEVPVGRYARAVLAGYARATGDATYLARVLANVASFETSARGVAAKVELGEADAGLVYATDVIDAARKLRALDIPAALQPAVEYSMAVVRASRTPAQAQAFVTYVRSDAGLRVLAAFGFGAP